MAIARPGRGDAAAPARSAAKDGKRRVSCFREECAKSRGRNAPLAVAAIRSSRRRSRPDQPLKRPGGMWSVSKGRWRPETCADRGARVASRRPASPCRIAAQHRGTAATGARRPLARDAGSRRRDRRNVFFAAASSATGGRCGRGALVRCRCARASVHGAWAMTGSGAAGRGVTSPGARRSVIRSADRRSRAGATGPSWPARTARPRGCRRGHRVRGGPTGRAAANSCGRP